MIRTATAAATCLGHDRMAKTRTCSKASRSAPPSSSSTQTAMSSRMRSCHRPRPEEGRLQPVHPLPHHRRVGGTWATVADSDIFLETTAGHRAGPWASTRHFARQGAIQGRPASDKFFAATRTRAWPTRRSATSRPRSCAFFTPSSEAPGGEGEGGGEGVLSAPAGYYFEPRRGYASTGRCAASSQAH